MSTPPSVQTELQLGSALRSHRRAQGMTQADVAARAGVSRSFVVDLENGKRTGAELGRVLSVLRALGLGLRVEELPAVAGFDQALAELLGDEHS